MPQGYLLNISELYGMILCDFQKAPEAAILAEKLSHKMGGVA